MKFTLANRLSKRLKDVVDSSLSEPLLGRSPSNGPRRVRAAVGLMYVRPVERNVENRA